MITDLSRFIAAERPHWEALEKRLDAIQASGVMEPSLDELQQLHYLYERTASGLARLATFSGEPETRAWLEALLARAYGELHSGAGRGARFRPLRFLWRDFPRAVRARWRAHALSWLVTLLGVAFGAVAVSIDPEAKRLLPFGHAQLDPAERVAQEEQAEGDRLAGRKDRFAAMLMTHNIKVSLLTFALGGGWGIGTVLLLFGNGVILGGICADYLAAGEGAFLAGWLLPHGSVEIPAIVLAGQAGLVLAGAIIGRGRRDDLATRLRAVNGDLLRLVGGVAVLLVWAGVIEAFVSQYHEPVLPYGIKIAFGIVQLILLAGWLGLGGRGADDEPDGDAP